MNGNGGLLEVFAVLVLGSFVAAIPFLICPRRLLEARGPARLTRSASRIAFALVVLGFVLPLSLVLRFRWSTGAWPTDREFSVVDGEPVFSEPLADGFPTHNLLSEAAILLAFPAVLLFVPATMARARARAISWKEPVAFAATYALLCAWPIADPGGYYWMIAN